MKKKYPRRVFFNASVILSGLHSPTGGSAKLLLFVKRGQIQGVISEIVFNEVLKHKSKINHDEAKIRKFFSESGLLIVKAPEKERVYQYQSLVSDLGDAHLLTSSIKGKCEFLVSLDKKHILNLKGKVKKIKIVCPKELLEEKKKFL